MILCGAKWSRYIREGDWFRLIAPMFLHAGIIHLLMNMYVLVTLGRDLESAFGWWRITVSSVPTITQHIFFLLS
jgi:rhomboid protease GluP